MVVLENRPRLTSVFFFGEVVIALPGGIKVDIAPGGHANRPTGLRLGGGQIDVLSCVWPDIAAGGQGGALLASAAVICAVGVALQRIQINIATDTHRHAVHRRQRGAYGGDIAAGVEAQIPAAAQTADSTAAGMVLTVIAGLAAGAGAGQRVDIVAPLRVPEELTI